MAVLKTSVRRLSALRPAARVPGWGTAISLCVFLFLFGPSALRAESREYQIKAAFLFNFAQFVLWPTTAFTNASEPFQIGVLGDNPFDKALQQTVQGETIDGRPIVVVESSQVEQLVGCQILFISKSQAAHFNDVFQKLDSKPVLTVSEDPRFIQHGGVINFYREGSKVRFEINPDVADKNGLKLGSQLLSVGKIVHSEVAK